MWKNLCFIGVVAALGCGGTEGMLESQPDGGASDSDSGQLPGMDAGGEESGDAGGEVVCWDEGPDDLLEDPDNCGSCGHSCEGATCVQGYCGTDQLLNSTDPIGAVSSDGVYIAYVKHADAGWEIHSMLTNGTLGQRQVGPYTSIIAPDALPIANTNVYFALNISGSQATIIAKHLDKDGSTRGVESSGQTLGAFAVDGDDLYWFFEDGKMKKTVLETEDDDTVSFGHADAVSAKIDGQNIVYWDESGLQYSPLSPANPVTPGTMNITSSAQPEDWAVDNGVAYWHDGASLRRKSLSGGSASTFANDGSGAVEASEGVVYVAEFDGDNDFINAYNADGDHLANIALFPPVVYNIDNEECAVYQRPKRIHSEGGSLYVVVEELSDCNNINLDWFLYRAVQL